MEILVKLIGLFPSSIRQLSKLVTDVVDKFVSFFEYLYPDFVQDVVDNMLTRLEELTSVLQMIRIKNSDCSSSVSDDLIKYRTEINTLAKKIGTLNDVILQLYSNIEVLEKQVDRAEIDFDVNGDNTLKRLLPFLKRNKEQISTNKIVVPTIVKLPSVLGHFEANES